MIAEIYLNYEFECRMHVFSRERGDVEFVSQLCDYCGLEWSCPGCHGVLDFVLDLKSSDPSLENVYLSQKNDSAHKTISSVLLLCSIA